MKMSRIEPLITPFVNMNGTSPKQLVEGYREAYTALREAIKKLLEVYPHGRDYQQTPEQVAFYPIAQRQHDERLKKLREIEEDMVALAIHVQDEQDRRRS